MSDVTPEPDPIPEYQPSATVQEPVPAQPVSQTQPVEPVAAQPMSESQPQVVYVAAPAPPLQHSNRLFGSLMALVGAVAFAVVYAGALAAYVAITGVPFQAGFSAVLSSEYFWVPILFFLVAFVLLALLLNRAGWAAFAFGGIVIALIVYFGSIALLLLLQGAIITTPAEASTRALRLAGNPGVVLATIVAREVSLWFGLVISRRGRKVTARNLSEREAFDAAEARKRAEYERAAARA